VRPFFTPYLRSAEIPYYEERNANFLCGEFSRRLNVAFQTIKVAVTSQIRRSV
jgi:hypothetical protein